MSSNEIHQGVLSAYVCDDLCYFFNTQGFLFDHKEIDNIDVQNGLYNNIPGDGYWRLAYEIEELQNGNFYLTVITTEFLGFSSTTATC